jgi:hypothetical protein
MEGIIVISIVLIVYFNAMYQLLQLTHIMNKIGLRHYKFMHPYCVFNIKRAEVAAKSPNFNDKNMANKLAQQAKLAKYGYASFVLLIPIFLIMVFVKDTYA